jgi:hypothetical protein
MRGGWNWLKIVSSVGLDISNAVSSGCVERVSGRKGCL